MQRWFSGSFSGQPYDLLAQGIAQSVAAGSQLVKGLVDVFEMSVFFGGDQDAARSDDADVLFARDPVPFAFVDQEQAVILCREGDGFGFTRIQ